MIPSKRVPMLSVFRLHSLLMPKLFHVPQVSKTSGEWSNLWGNRAKQPNCLLCMPKNRGF